MNSCSFTGHRFGKLAIAAGVTLAPALAQAHPFHGDAHSFAGGWQHPLLGWDHVLAMLGVGLWAAQRGGRDRWALPATFLGVMTLGGILAMAGLRLPGVEAGILASVMVLGLLIAAAARLPRAAAFAVVAAGALFHGHAHGAELPAGASGMAYALGFLAATALLHGVGMVTVVLARRQEWSLPVVRWAGAAMALAAAWLWVA